ncbi:MAG TPA: hypothetical protein VGK27_06740 [Candidatus Deferrimicrobiaceae bacterium]|jgi:hypothetical protein
MDKLSANQESFITLMKKSEEHARRGFEMLLARPGFEAYFDALEGAGLFDPTCNPAPVPADEAGFFRVSFWGALDYLKAVAKISDETKDLELAQKVMTVVRAVSRAREPDGGIRDNYHTSRIFAEIIGLVPNAAVSMDDLSLIPGWLEGRFERGMVGHALDEGALHRFLASDSLDELVKAVEILRHVTAVRRVDARGPAEGEKIPETVVEDYWLKVLIAHHSNTLGSKVGKVSSEILLERIREVLERENWGVSREPFRQAVEEHDQNYREKTPFNRFVEGLRDVLLSWVATDGAAAKPFIEALLRDEAGIVRRIGIYVLGQRWDDLRDIYSPVLGPRLFEEIHLHELYGLLKARFDQMELGEKDRTLEAIRQIPLPEGNEPERRRKRTQRRWLSAIEGKGHAVADAWFQELQSDRTLGALSVHPDFISYMESFFGSGPTPYEVQELLFFAETGTIAEKLNAFKQLDEWRGPSTKALVDVLEEAVGLAPETFLGLLPAFLRVKRPFQYGVINGFKRLWESPNGNQPRIDWDRAWNLLVEYLEALIGSPEFWDEMVLDQQGLTPTRDWIPPMVAEFLKAGTRNDAKAYPERLLPRTWALIGILLEHAEAEKEVGDDPMHQAINSSKGKVIESLINHALRVCRLDDKMSGSHAKAWAEMEPVFERELARCENANYEFSTLAGAYLTNLDYMSHEWLQNRVPRIFSPDFPANFICALGGLAFAPASQSIYVMLVKSGVLDRALQQELNGRHTREKLIERMAVAYLVGDEELDSPRFKYLFEAGLVGDLEDASGFFWSVSNQELSDDRVERILSFWDRCVAWSRTASELPSGLLSSLSRLVCYLESIGDKEMEWLLAVAPYVYVAHNADEFIEKLDLLADKNVAEVSAVFGRVIETYRPSWDYQDRIKSLLAKLADRGRKADAITYAERLRDLPGMRQLYDQLSSI